MKKPVLTARALMVAMLAAITLTVSAAATTLEIDNQTGSEWTIATRIIVPPKVGVPGQSQPTTGYEALESVKVPANTKKAVTLNTPGRLKSVRVYALPKYCYIKDFISSESIFTIDITDRTVSLKEKSGKTLGGCTYNQ